MSNLIEVQCTKCGDVKKIPEGSLTEEQRRGYLCGPCHEVIVERQVEERNRGDRRILTD